MCHYFSRILGRLWYGTILDLSNFDQSINFFSRICFNLVSVKSICRLLCWSFVGRNCPNTLGSRYPNCSDTETPPLVICYPNKFYPNYLILGVSISELVPIPRPLGGLGIRTQKNSDSLSEQILSELHIWSLGSWYLNRSQKAVKSRN